MNHPAQSPCHRKLLQHNLAMNEHIVLTDVLFYSIMRKDFRKYFITKSLQHTVFISVLTFVFAFSPWQSLMSFCIRNSCNHKHLQYDLADKNFIE